MAGILLAALLVMAVALAFVTNDVTLFLVFVALALVAGVLIVMPIGGADMPVVISLLNSYTGIAVAATGSCSATTRCSSPEPWSGRRARSSPSSCAGP